MNRSNSALDLTNQQEAAKVLPHSPLVASYHTGWEGLTFTHYCHPPHETVEHCLRQHSLVIASPKRCFQLERHLDGKFKHYAHGRGRVDIIPAFLDHRTIWNREIEFSVIAICPTLLKQAVQESLQREIELIPQFSISDPVIGQLALALKVEIQTGCLSGQLYGEALGSAIASRLIQNYAVSQLSPSLKKSLKNESSGLSPSQLSRVIDYIQAHLSADLSVLDLATLASMSCSHFSRSFKQSTGLSPYRYLLQQRIDRAKQLLKRQTIPISDVALDCGFANQTHLIKVFRQMTGTTPKAYQKR